MQAHFEASVTMLWLKENFIGDTGHLAHLHPRPGLHCVSILDFAVAIKEQQTFFVFIPSALWRLRCQCIAFKRFKVACASERLDFRQAAKEICCFPFVLQSLELVIGPTIGLKHLPGGFEHQFGVVKTYAMRNFDRLRIPRRHETGCCHQICPGRFPVSCVQGQHSAVVQDLSQILQKSQVGQQHVITSRGIQIELNGAG